MKMTVAVCLVTAGRITGAARRIDEAMVLDLILEEADLAESDATLVMLSRGLREVQWMGENGRCKNEGDKRAMNATRRPIAIPSLALGMEFLILSKMWR